MSDWLYRTIMVLLGLMLCTQIYVIVTTKPKPVMCLNGVIMEQHENMWIQQGMFPTFCVPVDKD